MNLKQHDDNRFSKEKTEMESYLLRIIQRYFEIESTYEKETVESIIVESLTRLKRDLLHYSGFIYSLNEMTGHITLTIRDFGGERAFDKNTAFNKDFGIDTDTICEGNDSRLSDQREPNEHVHIIDNIIINDITNLKDQIVDMTLSTVSHTHVNKNVLDMLSYTGNQVQIDLIVLENLQTATNNYCDQLSFKQNELRNMQANNLEVLSNLQNNIQEYFDNAKDIIQETVSWLNDIYSYTQLNVINFRDNILDILTKYLPKADLQEFIDYLNSGYKLLVDGELQIPDGEMIFDSSTSETIINTTNHLDFVPYSTTAFITKGKPKLYFRYTKDGVTKQVPLPFLFKTDTGNTILIQGSYTGGNRIFIETNCINKINMYATKDNLYNSNTLICAISTDKDSYGNIADKIKKQNGQLCLIKDSTKNAFVVNLLQSNNEYYIQGSNLNLDDETNFFDDNDNVMTFMDWDRNEPLRDCVINQLYFNTNKKWAAGDGLVERGYVAEFTIQRISNYFDNPRIYYQVFGSKEE